MEQFEHCPCCSGKLFAACCRDIIAGTVQADSPLSLMRSRYTAHVCKNMSHIINTMAKKALKLFDEEKTSSEWFEQHIWTKLEIIDAPPISKYDRDGYVEFKAHYTLNDDQHILHERSKFIKENGRWIYVSGQPKKPQIVTTNKVGRNDACPCGSGKKYKKCCNSNTNSEA